jgi:MFS family permease
MEVVQVTVNLQLERPLIARANRAGHKWWTLAAVCLGIFMLLIDISIVNVALPDIQRDLRSSFSGVQWVVDAYALTLAATLLTAGSLADLFGRRLLYLVGIGAFTVSSLLCGPAARCSSSSPAARRASAARSCSRCRWRSSLTRSAAAIAASRSRCGGRWPG